MGRPEDFLLICFIITIMCQGFLISNLVLRVILVYLLMRLKRLYGKIYSVRMTFTCILTGYRQCIGLRIS